MLPLIVSPGVHIRARQYSQSQLLHTGRMASRLVTVLVVLVCVGGVLTANGQPTHEDLSSQLQSLTAAVEEVGDDVEDLEDEVEDIADDVEDELEDLEEGIEAELEAVGQQVVSLREEVKSLKSHLETGLQDLEWKVVSGMSKLVERATAEMADLQNSTMYTLRELKEQITTLRQDVCNDLEDKEVGVAVQYLPSSCTETAELHLNIPTGYYWVHGVTGSPTYVYCDMARESCSCGSPRGWMRVAHLDMADPSQQCPSRFRLRTSPKRMCERTSSAPGCTSVTFPAHGVQYSRVCGRVRGYQYASPDGIGAILNARERTIDGAYVDGVSITHGQSPRKHIWTFGTRGVMRMQTRCNCSKLAIPFLGNNYFCDSGNYGNGWSAVLYPNALWDGEECGPTSLYPCCQFNAPPWFCRELPHTTTDNIEVRVCSDQDLADEDTPIDLIELYVQ